MSEAARGDDGDFPNIVSVTADEFPAILKISPGKALYAAGYPDDVITKGRRRCLSLMGICDTFPSQC
jgi:hypothetical protein